MSQGSVDYSGQGRSTIYIYICNIFWIYTCLIWYCKQRDWIFDLNPDLREFKDSNTRFTLMTNWAHHINHTWNIGLYVSGLCLGVLRLTLSKSFQHRCLHYDLCPASSPAPDQSDQIIATSPDLNSKWWFSKGNPLIPGFSSPWISPL